MIQHNSVSLARAGLKMARINRIEKKYSRKVLIPILHIKNKGGLALSFINVIIGTRCQRLFLLSLLAAVSVQGQDNTFTVTVRQPEHGRLTFSETIPADGRLPAGSQLRVSATPDPGYTLDSLYHEVPGIFGTMYRESMTGETVISIDQDMAISALFLPEEAFAGFTVQQDIVYAQPGVKALDYDIWRPDNAVDLPIIVIIHGGGWRANTEDIMRGMAREIVRTGHYVVASIDYRWIGTADGDAQPNTMDDLINDVFGAIAHIQAHAADYGGDPTHIGVTGDSAGGHLSAVAATMGQLIGDGGFGTTAGVYEFMPSYLPAGKSVAEVRHDIMTAVQAAAPSYGVFSSESYNGGPGLTWSPDDSNTASKAFAISPINFIPEEAERAVPHYLTRGTADPLISDTMVTEYVKALSARHQLVRYDQVPHASHAFFDWKPDARTRGVFMDIGVTYIEKMTAFFDEIFYSP